MIKRRGLMRRADGYLIAPPLATPPFLTVLTGTASPLVRANWLRDRGIEHLRDDRSTAITHRGERQKEGGGHLEGGGLVTVTKLCSQLDCQGLSDGSYDERAARRLIFYTVICINQISST